MRRSQKGSPATILCVCAFISACAILLLLRSGKFPVLSSRGTRADSASVIARSSGRYFYNRTAIRHMELTDVRQCYHFSRNGRSQALDVDTRDMLGCKQRLPSVLIIGTKEGGESTLRFFLQNHPSVVFSKEESQLHFFDRPSFRRAQGIMWYQDKMPYTSPDQIAIEATPDYFVSRVAPDGIRNDVVPKPKLLVVIRDPVKRALIEYHSIKDLGYRSEKPNKAWVNSAQRYPFLDSKRYVGDTFADSVIDEAGNVKAWNSLVNVGIYVIQLRRWYEWFGRTQIMIIDGDRLEKDPVPTLQMVEEFMGIPQYFDDTVVTFDANDQSRCVSKPFYFCDTPMKPYPLPDPATVQTLRSFYQRYDRQLYQMLNRNFTWFEDSCLFSNSSAKTLKSETIVEDVTSLPESSDQLIGENDEN